jgi:hypothetical protein
VLARFDGRAVDEAAVEVRPREDAMLALVRAGARVVVPRAGAREGAAAAEASTVEKHRVARAARAKRRNDSFICTGIRRMMADIGVT